MNSIAEFMSRDHDRLDAIFADFRKGGGGGKDLFSQFESGLRAHIGWEEDILFPPFEEKTGMRGAGPTAVMRMEHRQIKQLMQAVREGIGSPAAEESAKGLLDVLSAHNRKEEGILYPWLDQSLEEEERAALMARIRGG